MKTIQINLHKQLQILLSLFFFFNLLNVISIVYYKTEWNELFREMDFVIFLTIGAYFTYLFVKLFIIELLFRKKVS